MEIFQVMATDFPRKMPFSKNNEVNATNINETCSTFSQVFLQIMFVWFT